MPAPCIVTYTHPWSEVKLWSSTTVSRCAFCRHAFTEADMVVSVPTRHVPALVHNRCLNDPGCLLTVGGSRDPRID